jgi:hypothetical protein
MRDVRERAQGGIGKRWRRVRGANSGTVVGDEAGRSEDGATGDVPQLVITESQAKRWARQEMEAEDLT